MSKPFNFKQFAIHQDKCAMKVGTDGVLLGSWANVEAAQQILDIGTGTGLIALMTAQRNHNALVDAVEIDIAAYQQATENFLNSPFKNRLEGFNCSIQGFAKNTITQYDTIISNPPFFKKGKGSTAPNKRRQTVRQTDLLSFEDLIKSVVVLLKEKGLFSVILPYQEGLEFIELATENKLFCTRKTRVKGRVEKPIERLLLEFSKQKQVIEIKDLVIQNSTKRHDYTIDYVNLTKDFYTIL